MKMVRCSNLWMVALTACLGHADQSSGPAAHDAATALHSEAGPIEATPAPPVDGKPERPGGDAPGFTAGVAALDITPGWPVARVIDDGLVSKHYSNLEVKALAISETSGATVVFVTVDLIEICNEVSRQVYQRVGKLASAREAGLTHPEQQIILNASHAHTAPAVCPIEVVDPVQLDLKHQGLVVDRIVSAVDQALGNRRPATLGTSEGTSDINVNRRGPPTYWLTPDPDGPVDHRVRLLQVRDPASDALRAVLVLFACHPVSVDTTGDSYGADYLGFAREELAKSHPGVVVLTAQGTTGDVNPVVIGKPGDLAPSRMLGQRYAQAVDEAIRRPTTPVRGQIRSAMSTIELPVEAQSRDFVELAAKGMHPVYKAWPPAPRWGNHLLSTYYGKGLPVPRTWGPYAIRMVRFGDDFTIAALDGEPFTCIGRQIEGALSPAGSTRRTFVLGYTNDQHEYVPCAESFAQGDGGYEINIFFLWLQPARFAATVDKVIVDATVALASTLDAR